MKKFIILSLIILIILGLGAKAVLAMTEVKEIPKPKAYIMSVEGEVQIKKIGSEEWTEAKKNMEVATDDSIKTGDNAQVIINFYDNSTSRIGPNSEISFDELFIAQYDYAKTKVDINVAVGRVWSRILQIADKDTSFEVSSSATVATVRGTAFDFEVTPDGLAKVNTADSVIELATVKVKEEVDKTTGEKKKVKEIISKINLPEGLSASIDQKKSAEELKEIVTEKIPEQVKQSDWFQDNFQADKEFKQEIKAKQEKLNKEIAGVLPDSGMYRIKKLAEKTKIALTADVEKKQELSLAFTNRRLAEAQQLASQGKIAMAARITDEFMKEAKEKLAGADEKRISQIKNQLNLQKSLLREITPDNTKHEFKTKLEDLEINTLADEEDKKFLQFKKAKERLRELKLLKKKGEIELYNKYLGEYEKIIKSLEQLEDGRGLLERLKIEMEIIKKREEKPKSITEQEISDKEAQEEPEQPEDQIKELPQPELELKEQAKEQPQPLPEPPKPPEPEPKIEGEKIEALEPEPVPPPPNGAGQAEPKKLVELSVTADKYNMLTGATKQFKAMARYSDGSTKDVTNQAGWSLSGDIGAITQTGLLQTDEDGGKSFISAVFTEDGITISGTSPEVTALTIEF